MRTSQPFILYTTLLLLLSTIASASSWPKFLPDLDSLIVRRDDSSSSVETTTISATSAGSSAPTTTSGTSATESQSDASTITSTASESGSTSTESGSPSASGSGSKSTTKSGSTKSRSSTTTSSVSIDPADPAGGVSMTNPPVSSGSQYYKIGDYVTFGWNYTSLSVTPTAVDIFASCTANSNLYTLAVNQSVAESAVTWDTNGYQATATVPLLTETYTLIIYDAASSISATAQAGYLAVYDSYTFGMYSPQPYTPLPEFQCATCSGALSGMERRALGFMFGMSVITVLSFTWFVNGFNIIW